MHISTLTAGVRQANMLRRKHTTHQGQGLKIRWANTRSEGAFLTSSTDNNSGGGILGRPPFRPNHVTNTVFLLSIFQNTVISVTNHLGYPFNSRIMESKAFCIRAIASVFFCVACATEMVPSINAFLELAPMPSRASKIYLLVIFAFDSFLSFLADFICTLLFDYNRLQASKSQTIEEPKSMDTLASDLEERAIAQDYIRNKRFIAILVLMISVMTGWAI